MKKTNWVSDCDFEQKTNKFLKENTSLFRDLDIISEIHSSDVQKAGIDFLAERNHKLARIDFKAIAGVIPTFAFEVEGNIKTRQTGWMMQDNDTTHIAVIYLHFINDEGYYKNKFKPINHQTVNKVEVLLIDKRKLQEQINEWVAQESTFTCVSELCDHLRSLDSASTQGYNFNDNKEVIKRTQWTRPYSFVVSGKKLYERPINCVIRKEFLESFAEQTLIYEY